MIVITRALHRHIWHIGFP